MVVTLLTMSVVRPLGMCCHDDPGTARAIRLILDRCGFEVVADTHTAAEAVVAAAGVRPDVVVLDLDLAGTLGLGVVAALQAASPGSEVVVLSAFDTMRPAALAAGAHELVTTADLRDLERALSALARSRPGAAPRVVPVVAEDGQPLHDVRAASSPVSPVSPLSVVSVAARGTCRTKAPSS